MTHPPCPLCAQSAQAMRRVVPYYSLLPATVANAVRVALAEMEAAKRLVIAARRLSTPPTDPS